METTIMSIAGTLFSLFVLARENRLEEVVDYVMPKKVRDITASANTIIAAKYPNIFPLKMIGKSKLYQYKRVIFRVNGGPVNQPSNFLEEEKSAFDHHYQVYNPDSYDSLIREYDNYSALIIFNAYQHTSVYQVTCLNPSGKAMVQILAEFKYVDRERAINIIKKLLETIIFQNDQICKIE